MGVHDVLNTIWNQTCMPDQVLLYLASEEFPHKKSELPEELLALEKNHPFEIRWCDDLKPHKKYFYAMQEYPEDVLITIDDDILYPETMIENLIASYQKFPRAVSAARVHLMVIDEENHILPYKYWIKEVDNYVGRPSMQLFATGCSGILYPPHIFKNDIFDKETIKETCLYADDLWLKVIQVLSEIPVVAVQKYEELKYYPGSQKVALYKRNINEGENDLQLDKLMRWLDDTKQKRAFLENLTSKKYENNFLGIRYICEAFENEREKKQKKYVDLNNKLKTTYEEKSEINNKLKQAYREKTEINAKLKQFCKEKSETAAELAKLKELKYADEIRLQKIESEKKILTQRLIDLGDENNLLSSQIRNLQKSILEKDSELNKLNSLLFVRINKQIKRFFE